MSGWNVNLTEQEIRERDESMATLAMLADQVGLQCAQCGTLIRGRTAIGAVTYMAPFGTKDFQARAYCQPCADAMRGE